MNSVPEQNRNDRSNASAEAEQPAQQGQGSGCLRDGGSTFSPICLHW